MDTTRSTVRDACRSRGFPGAVLLVVFPVLLAIGAPKAEPWPRWERSDEASTVRVDHAPWTSFLQRYVADDGTGLNRVAYDRVTAEDRRALRDYVDALEAVVVTSLRRDEQRAYWTNLYNAVTVDVVLEHFPVDSIRDIDISPGFFSSGPWGKKLVRVEGVPVSLDDIEHRILRPIWKDPRVHYSVNCASVGCPNLLREAFEADRLEAQLDAAARAFVNHPRGAHVGDGELAVSSIYVWFREDFGDSDADVVAHLSRYAEPALREALAGRREIDDHDYDWSLNLAKSPATR